MCVWPITKIAAQVQKNRSRLVMGISTYDIMSFFVAGQGGQKWGEENKMGGKKFRRFQKSVIRHLLLPQCRDGGGMERKKKTTNFESYFDVFVGNCREKNLRNS